MALIIKMHETQSCRGLSLKSQGLYLLNFVTRYVHLAIPSEYTYYSLLDPLQKIAFFYTIAMKVLFLASSGYIVYLMALRYKYGVQSTSVHRAGTQS